MPTSWHAIRPVRATAPGALPAANASIILRPSRDASQICDKFYLGPLIFSLFGEILVASVVHGDPAAENAVVFVVIR